MRTVARGGSYFGSHISDRVLKGFQRPNPDAKDRHPMLRGLSPREIQVLRMVAEGKTSKDVAALLELGEHTVRSYRKTLMKKLGVNNVAGLTQVALSSGLIPPIDEIECRPPGVKSPSVTRTCTFSRTGSSRRLAAQAGMPLEKVQAALDWTMPPEDPAGLAQIWVHEFDRHGVARAALDRQRPRRRGIRRGRGGAISAAFLRVFHVESDCA